MRKLTIAGMWDLFAQNAVTPDITFREAALMKVAFACGITASQTYTISTKDQCPFILNAIAEFGLSPDPPTLEPSPN